MSETSIRATGIGKSYRLGGAYTAAPFESLRESFTSWVNWRQRRDPGHASQTIWALKDVSFETRVGEVVGIIGHNGAGKSTLLKILSRITEPTLGEAEIRGRVGSLLEVGTGFHPELTGRENVYLNGAILGMTRAEISRKFDEIVSFAGTEAFLDTPVKHYSSGMSMRLAFAVAAHLEPDTLIIDEILAVGDTAFQKKCLGKMDEVARRGRSVLFVSHNLGAVRTLCSRALVLDRGTVRFDGSASEAIAYYLAHSAAAAGEEGGEIRFGPSGQEFGNLTLHAVRVVDGRGEVRALFDAADPIRVEIEYEVLATLRGARTVLRVSTQEGDVAFQSTDHEARDVEQHPGTYTTRCLIPGALLNRRMYVVEIAFELPFDGVLAPCRPYLSFVVSGGGNHGSTFPEPWPGAVCPSLRWTTERD